MHYSVMSERTLLVGIDEAGYGPLLGPLVVSAAALDVPRDLEGESLWTLLAKSVSSKPAAARGRIPIVDSKKLHKPQEGIARLERTALTVTTAWRGMPTTLRELLTALCPESIPLLAQHPWYRDANPSLPLDADEGGIRISARLLGDDAAIHDVKIAGAWSEVLPEGHYNRLVKATHNKATVLLGLTLRLMQRVADAHPSHRIFFFIDKQGAREHYAPLLLKSFDDRRLRVLEEEPDRSAYEMISGESTWQVHFSQSGESRHMPTALASIFSKYLRESLMGCFNAYWRAHDPGLRATAGYYEDGHRFLRDIATHIDRLGTDRALLVRER